MTPLLARFDLVCFRWGCSLFMSGDLQDAGGPSIPLRMGRKDAPGPESQQPEGNLPGIGPHNVICGLHGLLIGLNVTAGSLQCDVLRCCGCAHAVDTLEAISHLLIQGRIQSLVPLMKRCDSQLEERPGLMASLALETICVRCSTAWVSTTRRLLHSVVSPMC